MKKITKNQIPAYKVAELPHLRVKIHFIDLSKLKGVKIEGSAYTTILSEDENLFMDIGIFIKDIEENIKRIECTPMFVHEILHVIQIICAKRLMCVEEEQEHMAYIASYLLEKLLNK